MKKTLKKLIRQAAHFGLVINRGEPPELPPCTRKTPAARLRRAISAQIPGSGIAVAATKRKYEHDLRKAGHSRKGAARLTWEHFQNRA